MKLISRAMTLVELMVVVAIVALLAAVAVPGLQRARISANEATAIATLHAIAAAQEAFRQDARVDLDDDGEGEYGLVAELCGRTPARGRERAGATYIEGLELEGKIAVRDGYCFVVYLPTANEPSAEPGRGDARAAELQERRFVVYAWPVEYGSSGHRAFVIDQRGQLHATLNRGMRYSGLESMPVGTAAYDLSGPSPITLEARLGGRGKGVGDQQVWQPPAQ